MNEFWKLSKNERASRIQEILKAKVARRETLIMELETSIAEAKQQLEEDKKRLVEFNKTNNMPPL